MSRKRGNFAKLGCLTLWLPLMPGRHPCNTYETAHRHSVAREMAMTAASTVWQHERYAGHNLTIAKVVADHDVPHTTLSARLRGRRSISAFNRMKAHFTNAEETQIIHWMLWNADCGHPVDSCALHCYADKLLKELHGPDCPPLGPNWVAQFHA